MDKMIRQNLTRYYVSLKSKALLLLSVISKFSSCKRCYCEKYRFIYEFVVLLKKGYNYILNTRN